MMTTITKTFKGSDGKDIFYHNWEPENDGRIKGVVQIAHGMSEHSARYARFAKVLTGAGFAVYANDHRGHGQTAGALSNVGYFEEGNFWDAAVDDMYQLNQLIKNRYSTESVFIVGHSMGSMLARHYVTLHGDSIDGVVFSGTGGDPGLLGVVGSWIAKTVCFFQGRKAISQLLDTLSFGKFNDAFKPNRTVSDWLSRDNAEVDKYVSDPYCGVVFSAGFFADLLYGVGIINSQKTYAATPKNLPILLLAGDKDPVGDNGKGVKEVFGNYEKAGIKDVHCTLYKDGRHEMLNETNRDEVMNFILNWIKERVNNK